MPLLLVEPGSVMATYSVLVTTGYAYEGEGIMAVAIHIDRN